MHLLVGLGNPGPNYENTRHNVGFLFIQRLLNQNNVLHTQNKFRSETAKVKYFDEEVLLMMPQDYMNLSGQAVLQALQFFKLKPENLIVIFDDLDQQPFAVRARIGGGHGGHNGIKSILDCLQTDQFHRVKVGIGKPDMRAKTSDYVLGRFSPEELKLLEEQSFPLVEQRIKNIFKTTFA